MTALSDLIARLETADEGSAELDKLIRINVIGFNPDRDLPTIIPDIGGIPSHEEMPYTRSVDTASKLAMKLLPPGFGGTIGIGKNRYTAIWIDHNSPSFSVQHKPAALALCIAALKAREAAR